MKKTENKTPKIVKFIDPPDGWRYGFPKVIPYDIESKDISLWFIENGYPEELIKSYGEHFYYRTWEQEIDNEDGE